MKGGLLLKKKYKICFCTAIAASLLLSGCSELDMSDHLINIGLVNYEKALEELFGASSSISVDELLTSLASPISQTAKAQSVNSADVSPYYMEYSYYLSTLEGDELNNLLTLYGGIMNFEETITLAVPVSDAEAGDLMNLLINECPELLMLDSRWVEHTNLHGNVVSISPEYCIDRALYDKQLESVSALLAQWQSELSGKGAFDAELYIYDYIIDSCQYSTSAAYCQSAYGALVSGLAKCDGRAKALVWALRSLGITSSVITGSNHAWVIARIGDYDYNVDPTYDDNENDVGQLDTAYAYFNVPESAIFDNPYPADDFFTRRGLPATVRWDANYHVQTRKWIASSENSLDTARAAFNSQLQLAYENDSGFINLRFESSDDCKAALNAQADWIQSFINTHFSGCSITAYDFSKDNMLTIRVSFK